MTAEQITAYRDAFRKCTDELHVLNTRFPYMLECPTITLTPILTEKSFHVEAVCKTNITIRLTQNLEHV